MSSKPISHSELIEPLQSFLESFTQELTEQKFVPAFRDELKRLLASLENLQQSEDTLQQIARGVDRLREVFAPAGTRLLESVKDLETVMRGHTDQLKERAEDVLKDLLQTHEQLETAMRSEAGLLQEQTSASREALSRTIAEIEGRLTSLTSHVDGLAKRVENERIALCAAAPEAMSGGAAPASAALPATVRMELPDDLRNLISHSEESVTRELERYHEEITGWLKQGRTDESERLSKLDHRITEALSSVGPRVQEELENAVSRLRDQMQTLILAEVETRTVRGEGAAGGTTASSGDTAAAITASETRILREIGTLQKAQKSDNAERILRELVQGLEEATQKYAERATADSQSVRDSLTSLQRIFSQVRDAEQQNREQLAVVTNGVDTIVKGQREHHHVVEEQLRATQVRLDSQVRTFEQKAEEDRQMFGQLAAAMTRAEQAATSATDLAMTDSRAQRERIEIALKDLRERIERGLSTDSERTYETLRQIAEAWTEALEALREFVSKTITGRTDSIVTRLEGIETRLAEAGQTGGSVQRELQNEIKRTGSVFDERIQTLKTDSDAFVQAIETHVKAVSSEVAALRAKQDQSLAVLKEAIRANYDENAVRLKEVIESAYDSYAKQTAAVPQALDRVVHLVQSLNQGDQIALQTVVSDTKNILSLSNEKFELLVSDNNAIKKFFPLLDRRLEKQQAELEMARKAQVRQDKELSNVQAALTQNRDWQDEQMREIRSDLSGLQTQTGERFENTQDDLSQLKADVSALHNEHLPSFRRELSTLLTSKFEFIENTLHERQETLRKEMEERQDADRAVSKKNFMILAALIAVSILVQVVLQLTRTPGAGR
ncbi:hypothetical protein EHM69_02985 [candidate division KSB1 bacterium]|nr:MAG: hypothetical protein EHM69_02985 [candidate division KSB1 bacterium]